jgi:hypothetical protein
MDIPKDPAGAYKRIIDECVEFAQDVNANRIRSGEPVVPTDPKAPENLLVQSLSQAQRQTLAKMLDDARSGGVHDLLSRLTWWIMCAGLRLGYRGQPVPVDFSGAGLHGDYIGRLAAEDTWEWPKKSPMPPPPWEPNEEA